jgi:glucose/arabinose dehydrogenase
VRPTSLQWGPDNRLYVSNQDGLIKAYTVTRSAKDAYSVTATETIDLVNKMPNRNDNGALNTAVEGRLVTGIAVTGSAASPIIYVASSDPRIGGGRQRGHGDLELDTNSGIISKLTKSGGTWTKQDLVRGLPRSEENHTANGLALSADGKTLYVAQGGNTNQGRRPTTSPICPSTR